MYCCKSGFVLIPTVSNICEMHACISNAEIPAPLAKAPLRPLVQLLVLGSAREAKSSPFFISESFGLKPGGEILMLVTLVPYIFNVQQEISVSHYCLFSSCVISFEKEPAYDRNSNKHAATHTLSIDMFGASPWTISSHWWRLALAAPTSLGGSKAPASAAAAPWWNLEERHTGDTTWLAAAETDAQLHALKGCLFPCCYE